MKRIACCMILVIFLFAQAAVMAAYAQVKLPRHARIVTTNRNSGDILKSPVMDGHAAAEKMLIAIERAPGQEYRLEATKGWVRKLFHIPAKRYFPGELAKEDQEEYKKMLEEAHY